MRTARAALAALLLPLLGAPATAQPQVPPAAASPVEVMAWIIGEWRGSGTMFGRPSEATLSVRPVLGDRFIEFSYRAGQFEGRAFYAPTPGGGWRAQWFDNRGVTFPIEAREIERALTSEWGSAETERGRTVYRLADDGRLHLTDSVRRPDGSWRDFASHVLTRVQ